MIEDIFREFINLGYKSGTLPSKDRDIHVKDLIIMRIGNSYLKILYLFNGSCLNIPWSWIDLFSSLNTWGGDRILFQCQEERENPIANFIEDFINIAASTSCSRVSSEFLDWMSDACEIGTRVFKDWCIREGFFEVEKKLGPFEFVSIDKNLEI